MGFKASSTPVQIRYDGVVAVIAIDNPPVNALSTVVRAEIFTAVKQANESDVIQAILLVGKGKSFIAGADIREFGKPLLPPSLSEVIDLIETSPKLVVASVHGYALGGGLELALACHYRIALASTRLGLPEVNLGLLPGAGGTQRAPRLMGVKAALDLMVRGKHITAAQACETGLIDQIAQGADAEQAGLSYIRHLLETGAMHKRTRDVRIADKAAAVQELEEYRAETIKKYPNLLSPLKIIECVRNAVELPFDQGIAKERQAFLECMGSPQRMGLTHAFFAEREVVKVPGANATPRPIHRVAVIGGGTMGAGIAVAMLDAGLPVVMLERDEQSLAAGQAKVEGVYDALVRKGRLSHEQKQAVMARCEGTTDYSDVAQADVVIEAVFEDMQVKQAVFAQLDAVCKPGAVLATNTSFLDINAIANSTSRPQEVIGLHFFSPANIMKLLEIVVTSQVKPDVVATAFYLAKILKKVPVRAGVCDGFIGNRIISVYKRAAEYIMEDGASPYEIDQAVRDFGFPMGPFQVVDLAGGDIGWATRKRKSATRNKDERYVEIADRLCERGWFGQKTGRGFYLYPDGSRTGLLDDEVLQIIARERTRKGIQPKSFSKEEILRRYTAAMINEGANVLNEGIALRPLDIDITFIYGYGFPRFRGGPMKYADMVGLNVILEDIQSFAKEDPVFWKPSPLLLRLVQEGKNFDSLNVNS